jgi:hypothetical protein
VRCQIRDSYLAEIPFTDRAYVFFDGFEIVGGGITIVVVVAPRGTFRRFDKRLVFRR